jgi:hypothetical protein
MPAASVAAERIAYDSAVAGNTNIKNIHTAKGREYSIAGAIVFFMALIISKLGV